MNTTTSFLISLHGHGVDLGERFQAFAQRRAMYTLHPFTRMLSRLDVRLADSNGPRAGRADKVCAVHARLASGGVAIATARHQTLAGAMADALTRLATQLRQEHDRAAHHRR